MSVPARGRSPFEDPAEEGKFQSWYAARAEASGLDSNPDAPAHRYDYRAAFKAGAEPDPETKHWPSEHKLAGHPNRYVDGEDTITGQRETTTEASWVDGLRPYTRDDEPTSGIQGIQATKALAQMSLQTVSAQRWDSLAEDYRAEAVAKVSGGEAPEWYRHVRTHKPMVQFARRYMTAGELRQGPDGIEATSPRARQLLRNYAPAAEAAFKLAALEQANPGKVPTDAELRDWIRTTEAGASAVAAEDARRAPGWSNIVGMVGGALGDPAVLATLPLGAESIAASGTRAIARTALRAGATDAAIVAAVEVPIQAQVLSFKRDLGSPYELKDAALNVLAASIGAGVLRATGSVLLDSAAPFKVRAQAAVDAARTAKLEPEAKAAATTIEDYLDELARSPFPENEAVHFEALEKASADMATMEPVRVEEIVTARRRTDADQSMEVLLRAESNRLAAANRAAEVYDDPLENALSGAASGLWNPERAAEAAEWGLANGRPDIAQVALQRAEDRAELTAGVVRSAPPETKPRLLAKYKRQAADANTALRDIQQVMGRPAAAPLARPGPAAEHIPGGELPALDRFQVIDPLVVGVDAARFQFKAGGNAAGVTDRLKGVEKFDPKLGGQVLVWEEAAGVRWIVDGHQRLGLAKRAIAGGQPAEEARMFGYVLREADGVTPSEARVVAAFKNIAEGTGTPIDAAKVLREASGGEHAMVANLPPNSALVRDARGLAQLEDEPFMAVVNEVIPAQYGAIVGDLIKGGPEQASVIQLLAKLDPANATQARMIIEQARAAGFERAKTGDLFGEADLAENLYLERAKVADAAMRRLRQDRATFRTLKERGETIQEAGNVLDHAANERRLQNDDETIAAISRTFNQRGPISEALTDVARGLKSGGRLGDQADAFLARVRSGDAGAAPGRAGEGEAALVDLPPIRVYHGTSIADIEKFDLEKIGSGEGAQAYGWGIYTAEHMDVAKNYAPRSEGYEAELMRMYKAAERREDYAAMEVLENFMLHETPGEVAKKVKEMEVGAYQKAGERALRTASKVYTNMAPPLYALDLPGAAVGKMLDWDKPLRDQPANVQEAFAPLLAQAKKSFPDIDEGKMTGGEAYRIYAEHRGGNAKTASETLRAAGIPGIRYLDQGSRDVGKGTSNFVLFDPDVATIVQRKVDADLFGEAPVAAQAMHDARLAVAAGLSGPDVPVGMGAGDLFTSANRQVDMTDLLGPDAKRVMDNDALEYTDTLTDAGRVMHVPESVVVTRDGPEAITRPAGVHVDELRADGEAVNAVKLCAMGGGGGEG